MSSYPFTSALVTGASSGIGAGFAELLGAAGVPTVIVARREDRLRELAERYPSLEVLAADLTTADGLERVAARAGQVDLVVNNAGFGSSGPFVSVAAERLAREIALNVAAVTRISHAALAAMVPNGRGYLLNVSSAASFQSAPNLAVYAATKAYVTSLGESLHEEVRGTGVHVTTLCPGLTPTEFQSVSSSNDEAAKYPRILWTSVELVAKSGLTDVVRGKCLSIPGWVYKGMIAAGGVTPRGVTRRLGAMVLRR